MPVDSGFVQFNTLVVQSISSQTAPAEIIAGMGGTGIYYNGTTGTVIPPTTPIPAASSVAMAAPSGGNCLQFENANDNTGTPIACPVPPAMTPPGAGAAPATAASGTAAAMPAIYPNPSQLAYRIEIGATTTLMLRDRTPATLANFSSGDEINVFGYYNPDGSIQAYLVRDTSKPAETQTIQLDNVTLLSLSGTSIPATLAVTQQQGAPCYSFGASGNGAMQPFACPLGVSSFSADPATANLVAPAAEPAYVALNKYAVTVDAQTIILDRNRATLTLGDLQPGDELNVYGETSDNGQTVDADIVRDLSVPPVATAYAGTVTQVNADGSFAIRTDNGQTVTVPNPVAVGAKVSATGILNSSGTLTAVSGVTFGNGGASGITVPPIPLPMPAASAPNQ